MKKSLSVLANIVKSLILPIGIFLLFVIGTKGSFFSTRTILMMFKQSLFPCLIAWGISFNMTMGVFDFSPGAVIVLSGIVGGNLARITETGMLGMVLFTVTTGAALCMINCIVFVKLKIPSLIMSLGMLMIYETLAAILFDGGGVTIPMEWRILYSVPYVYILFAAVFLILLYINKYTRFAFDVRSLGYGTEIAVNIGVDLTKTRFKAFLVEGILLGLATVIDMSVTGSEKAVQGMASSNTAFAAIMAVFVGQYLAKYCGMMVGTFIGAFSLKILAAGTLAIGLSSQMQKVSNGVFLIVFVGISQNLARIDAGRKRKKLQKVLLSQI